MTAPTRLAARLFERTVELEPTNYTAWGLLSACLGVIGEAERKHEAHLRALELIDRQLEKWAGTGAGGSWLQNDPDFDSLRDDPRFRAVLERIRGR